MSNLRYETNKNINKCIKFIETMELPQINKGGQSKIYKLEQQNCGIAIVKKYLDSVDKSDIENEIKNLLLVKSIINTMCPNFIYIYDYSYEKKYIIVEYCDGDLESLFIKSELSENIIKSILFQILCGIYTLQTIGIIHYDLKYRNIFYKKTSDEFIYYKINNVIYKIQTFGYLILIADFGLTKYIKTDIQNIIKEYYYLPLYNHNLLLLKYIIVNKKTNLDKFIIHDKIKNYFKLKKEIFSENIKFNKKLSKLFYLSLENNYINYKMIYNYYYNDIIKNNIYIQWLDKYDIFLQKIFLQSMYIPDILYKNFSEFITNNADNNKIYVIDNLINK